MTKRIRQLVFDQRGFTLMEMLLVLFIVSVLMLLVVPGVSKQQDKASETGDAAFHASLQSQINLYRMDEAKVPASFEALETAGYLTAEQEEKATASYTIGTDGKVQPKTGD